MNDDGKQQLYYLMNGLLSNEYDSITFCDEFYRIYNFEMDNVSINSEEENYEIWKYNRY